MKQLPFFASAAVPMSDPMIVDTFLSVFQTLSAEIGPSVAPTTPSVAQSRALNQIAKASANQDAEPSERFDDTSASTDELLALYDLSKSLSSPIALADVGDVIAKHVRRMIPASLCVFFVYDSADDVPRRRPRFWRWRTTVATSSLESWLLGHPVGSRPIVKRS